CTSLPLPSACARVLRSCSPPPSPAAARRRSCDLRLSVRGAGGHARLAALRARSAPARALGPQRAGLDHGARERRGDPDPGGARNRGRLDQGVHVSACGARLPCHCGGPPPPPPPPPRVPTPPPPPHPSPPLP